MANYKITIENIRPQDKIALSKATGLSDNVKFSVVADKIIAYDENGNETDFVLSGESVIDTTITDVADYEETHGCHGFIYANGYLWASMRTYGTDTIAQTSAMPQILKINPYDLDDYEILYYDYKPFGSTYSSSVDQIVYANGYIWFPRSYRDNVLIRLDPSISLSDPSCYEEYSFGSDLRFPTTFSSTLTYNNNYIYITGGGASSDNNLPISSVSLSGTTISFTISGYEAIDIYSECGLGGLIIDGDQVGGYVPIIFTSKTISSGDTIITGEIKWYDIPNNWTISPSASISFQYSNVVKFDISNPLLPVFEKEIFIPFGTNFHAAVPYENGIVTTTQESQSAGQICCKIDEFDNYEIGLIPSFTIGYFPSFGYFYSNRTITDDICIIGNYGYFGNEQDDGNTSRLFKFNLQTMTNDSIAIISDVNACYGTFAYNNQIYALYDRSPGKIVIFDTDLNITQEIILPDGYDSCNEFVVTDDSIYIAFWETRPLRIIRIPNLDESGFVADPQIVLDSDDKYVTFNAYRKNEVVEIYNLYEFDDSEKSYSESGNSYLEVSDSDMINTIKWNYPEESFPYKILKNTTEYDPFSYISYDYMISTSRTAKFDAFIDDYFDDDTFDFINNLTRVGYKKKIDENNGKYDNDITLYNHFYYSTEDDEDEFVRIELDDNTREYEVGSTVTDKYGEVRTVSSREIITEGVSTLMCRIYELTTDSERLVYSGLIDKRETKFDGTKLSVSLIDMMGLYVELSEKYNITIQDREDSGLDLLDLTSAIKTYIYKLKNDLNISNDYLPDENYISSNAENAKMNTVIREKDYLYNDGNFIIPVRGRRTRSSNYSNAISCFIPISIDVQNNDTEKSVKIEITEDNIDSISNNLDLSTIVPSSSALAINMSGINTYALRYYYDGVYASNYLVTDLFFSEDINKLEKRSYDYTDSSLLVYFGLKYNYSQSKIYLTNKRTVSVLPVIIIVKNGFNEMITLGSEYELLYDVTDDLEALEDWEYGYPYEDYVLNYNYANFVKNTISDKLEEINDILFDFSKNLTSNYFGEIMFYNASQSKYLTNVNSFSIFDNIENGYKYLKNIKTYNRINNIFDTTYGGVFKCIFDEIYTSTYLSVVPLYAGDYSLYDITKLFSLTCYNKILTKNTGELYFDKESYSENNGYIYIDKSDIINNFSQQSMIGDDEEFEILDNVYVGTKYIKEAYKRLETSTKENYKKLYENNNMKVSFNLRNHIYDIKSNLTTTIDQREIEPKDVIRIMHNGYEKIRVFVTSVKFINNNTEIEIEGITLQTRNITVSHLKSDSK